MLNDRVFTDTFFLPLVDSVRRHGRTLWRRALRLRHMYQHSTLRWMDAAPFPGPRPMSFEWGFERFEGKAEQHLS